MEKAKFLITVLVLLSIHSAIAQKGSLSLGLNAGFNMGQQNIIGEKFESTDLQQTQEVIQGSNATGINFSVDGMYGIGEFVDLGLIISYFSGFNPLTDSWVSTGTGFSYNEVWNSSHNRLAAIPNLRIHTNNENDVSFFAEAGLIIPITQTTNWKYQQNDNGEITLGKKTSNYNFIPGCSWGGGINLNISNNLFLNLGVTNTVMGTTEKTSEITELTRDGQNILADLEVYDRQANYVTMLGPESNNFNFNFNSDTNKPRDVQTSDINLNSIGVEFGINLKIK